MERWAIGWIVSNSDPLIGAFDYSELPQIAEEQRGLNFALRAILGNKMAQIIIETQAIAGYELPPDARKGFLAFHKFITDPEPYYISKWRASKETEHWYHRHVNGVLGDVQSAVARAYYHSDRMAKIEDALLRAIEQVDYKSRLGNSVFAIGNTPKWDFEYQAFVLATRSALDYLRRALSDCPSRPCFSGNHQSHGEGTFSGRRLVSKQTSAGRT